jgi:hypothetical protein
MFAPARWRPFAVPPYRALGAGFSGPFFNAVRVASVKVYHITEAENAPNIERRGFRGPIGGYLSDSQQNGVWVSDQPLLIESALQIESVVCFEIAVSDRVLLSREWTQIGKGYRRFLVPAAVLNRFRRRRLSDDELSQTHVRADSGRF